MGAFHFLHHMALLSLGMGQMEQPLASITKELAHLNPIVSKLLHNNPSDVNRSMGSIHEHGQHLQAGHSRNAQDCMWDLSEFLLKASFAVHEDALVVAWVRGYLHTMACFPRLHVITGEEHQIKARRYFEHVPNVTIRENALSLPIQESLNMSSYFLIQWHIMWADNFTKAPYIMYFDVDAVPILPLNCQHMFDDEDRVLVHSWNRGPGPPLGWIPAVSNVFVEAEAKFGEKLKGNFTQFLQGWDFMTFWPLITPRRVLPTIRRLVSQVPNVCKYTLTRH